MNDPVPGLSGVINVQQAVAEEAWTVDMLSLSVLRFGFSPPGGCGRRELEGQHCF